MNNAFDHSHLTYEEEIAATRAATIVSLAVIIAFLTAWVIFGRHS